MVGPWVTWHCFMEYELGCIITREVTPLIIFTLHDPSSLKLSISGYYDSSGFDTLIMATGEWSTTNTKLTASTLCSIQRRSRVLFVWRRGTPFWFLMRVKLSVLSCNIPVTDLNPESRQVHSGNRDQYDSEGCVQKVPGRCLSKGDWRQGCSRYQTDNQTSEQSNMGMWLYMGDYGKISFWAPFPVIGTKLNNC